MKRADQSLRSRKGFNAELEDQLVSRFRTACQDSDVWKRVKPFAGLVRLDDVDYPVVITTGSVFVTAGTDRRSSGTHYTPKSLTEPIVQYTLEPLVYVGPAEGLPKDQWKLRSAKELLALKICDMACGSGAFLVQACRYMAARLLEAWDVVQRANPGTVHITPEGEASTGKPGEMLIPDDPDERQTYALRIVAQRCLYGVDKNPLAAEMAKLSLWLLTLAKDKPFEFLDHAIRCGDSLVGLGNIVQLLRFSMTENAKVRPLMEQQRQQIEKRLQATMLLRTQIETLPSNTPQDIERKTKMLENVEDQTKRLRYAADILLATTWEAKNTSGLESALNGMLAEVEYKLENLPAEELDAEATAQLRKAGIAGRFHWPLEFPEIFIGEGGFDAVVGNPPFLGGTRIRKAHGLPYLQYLQQTWGSGNRADYCAYFFLRAHSIVHSAGEFSFIATNTIAEGDTRELAVERLLFESCTIRRATTSLRWPGAASLEIALVWFHNGRWDGEFQLNNNQVTGIDATLSSHSLGLGKPSSLLANRAISFTGVKIYGQGFTLNPEESESLRSKDPKNSTVMFPYLSGEDVNTDPEQRASRWVINFFDWPLNRFSLSKGSSEPVAADFPDCLRIVEERVKPERTIRKPSGAYVLRSPLPQRWWIYGDKRPALYSAISELRNVTVGVIHTKYWAVSLLATRQVFSHALIIFASDDLFFYSVLSSSFHETWTRQYSSSLETRLRYTPSDCFETFPFPLIERGSGSGGAFSEHRASVMRSRKEGLTATYNRFHDTEESAADIQKLRDLHVEMDKGVAAAYGWTDLQLGHGFHETKQGVRYTIGESARREVLARLLKLNHERYGEEVKQGLHEKKRRPANKPVAKKTADKPIKNELTLFDMQEGDE